jgi:hypothetical protein
MTREEALQQARELRDEYAKAELAILRGGQSYTIAGQTLTRASLAEIRKYRMEQEAIIANLQGGLRRFRRVIPVDD